MREKGRSDIDHTSHAAVKQLAHSDEEAEGSASPKTDLGLDWPYTAKKTRE